jgi:hypothetical protein
MITAAMLLEELVLPAATNDGPGRRGDQEEGEGQYELTRTDREPAQPGRESTSFECAL